MPGRLVLLVTTPRVAPGLLSRPAWAALEGADLVLAADPSGGTAHGLVQAGMPVGRLPRGGAGAALLDLAGDQDVVWVLGDDGDPGLTDEVAAELAARAGRSGAPAPEVEVLTGSHDVPGARILDLVAVMDRLRSPGGCPWDADQTPVSLLRYLIEETFELVEAVESGDQDHVREELGDVLLQVAFQARVAQDHPDRPFDIDDVAAGIVEKLVRRHPHVFAGAEVSGADQVAQRWQAIKAAEKPARGSVLDGIPAALPALARAEKVLGRLAGDAGASPWSAAVATATAAAGVGPRLLALAEEARQAGLDPEAELRAAVRGLQGAVTAAEARAGAGTAGNGPRG